MRADIRHLGDPGTVDFQVRKYPFYLLNRLVSRYNTIIETQLRAIGLDIPFWRVLMILGERAPQGVGDISEAAVINLSTMTRIVQRMARGKLVRCTPRTDDYRITDVFLTPLGKRKLAAARKITAPVFAAAIAGFSQREFRDTIETLDKLYTNLGPLLHNSGRPKTAKRKYGDQ
ncbi:MAG: MarR family winged helix-turn-helix transcriptional regulator [Rhizomicrobium sp.]